MKTDAITKNYVRNADIFADIFNFYIYNGKQVILPEQLSERDSTKIALPYGDDGKALPVQKFRDIQKLYSVMTDGRVEYVLYGAENQTEIHYAMPVRNNLYDALDYAGQVENTARMHRKEKSRERPGRGEFLSGFWKKDRLIPSITLTIYFGADEWDGPLSLFDMMGTADSEVLACMDNYHVRLVSPARMSDEDILKFQSSLREVMFFIKYSKNPTELTRLVEAGQERFKNLERRAADVIAAVTGAKFSFDEDKERVDMCRALQEMCDNSRAEGMVLGKAEGIVLGRSEGIVLGRSEGELRKAREIALNLYAMGLRVELIAEGVGCSVDTVKDWIGISSC